MTKQFNCTLKEKYNACAGKGGCETCGWYAPEMRRRKTLPLVKGKDGLRHKIVAASRPDDAELYGHRTNDVQRKLK